MQQLQPRSLEGIANYLRFEYWSPRQFDLDEHKVITVNLAGLTHPGRILAVEALETWSDVTGITFRRTKKEAQITFDDAEDGAFAQSGVRGEEVVFSTVNIGKDWLERFGTAFDSYSFQTYIHEIGHALGLGHPGPYNDTADFETDAAFANDSWQTSVMSYFSQGENPNVNATSAFTITPMGADILAAQAMYGAANDVRLGDTTYGFNDTTGEARLELNDTDFWVAATLIDSGGIDTLDFSGYSTYQSINLNDRSLSSYGGGKGNLSIGAGTVIENVIGGAARDRIIANEADNVLTGGAGADIFVFRGKDLGQDRITDFEFGVDTLDFRAGAKAKDFEITEAKNGLLLLDQSDGEDSIFLAGLTLDQISIDQLLV